MEALNCLFARDALGRFGTLSGDIDKAERARCILAAIKTDLAAS